MRSLRLLAPLALAGCEEEAAPEAAAGPSYVPVYENGKLKLGRFTIHDTHPEGWITAREAFKRELKRAGFGTLVFLGVTGVFVLGIWTAGMGFQLGFEKIGAMAVPFYVVALSLEAFGVRRGCVGGRIENLPVWS